MTTTKIKWQPWGPHLTDICAQVDDTYQLNVFKDGDEYSWSLGKIEEHEENGGRYTETISHSDYEEPNPCRTKEQAKAEVEEAFRLFIEEGKSNIE